MKPRTTLLLSIVPVCYLLALTGWSYSLGFPESGNEGAFAQLWILIGYLMVAAVVLVCLVAIVRGLLKRTKDWIFPVILAAALLPTSFYFKPLASESFYMGVRRDLRRHDLAAIGLEVEALLKKPETGDSDGYFGLMIPVDQVPSHLRGLSGDAFCTRSKEGIVIRTDGFGGWRGGYLFLPPNRKSSNPGALAIMPGVYYVISQ